MLFGEQGKGEKEREETRELEGPAEQCGIGWTGSERAVKYTRRSSSPGAEIWSWDTSVCWTHLSGLDRERERGEKLAARKQKKQEIERKKAK